MNSPGASLSSSLSGSASFVTDSNAFGLTHIKDSRPRKKLHFADCPHLFPDFGNNDLSYNQEQEDLQPQPRETPKERPVVVLPPILTANYPYIPDFKPGAIPSCELFGFSRNTKTDEPDNVSKNFSHDTSMGSTYFNSNSVSRKRRSSEDITTGREKSQKGIFGQSDTLTDGLSRNTKMLDESNHVFQKPSHDTDTNSIPYLKDEIQSSLYSTTSHKSSLEQSPSSSKMRTKIRVFGFDNDNAHQIISFFTKLGDLAEPLTSHGHWVTINYTTHEAALKALSYHGKRAENGCLIGVAWDECARASTGSDLVPLKRGFRICEDGLIRVGVPKTNYKPPIQTMEQQATEQPGMLKKLREKYLGW